MFNFEEIRMGVGSGGQSAAAPSGFSYMVVYRYSR